VRKGREVARNYWSVGASKSESIIEVFVLSPLSPRLLPY